MRVRKTLNIHINNKCHHEYLIQTEISAFCKYVKKEQQLQLYGQTCNECKKFKYNNWKKKIIFTFSLHKYHDDTIYLHQAQIIKVVMKIYLFKCLVR